MRKRQGMQLFVVLVVLIASVSCDEDDAKKFLDDINDKYVTKANSQKLANWIYENEIKPENIDSKVNHFSCFAYVTYFHYDYFSPSLSVSLSLSLSKLISLEPLNGLMVCHQ